MSVVSCFLCNCDVSVGYMKTKRKRLSGSSVKRAVEISALPTMEERFLIYMTAIKSMTISVISAKKSWGTSWVADEDWEWKRLCYYYGSRLQWDGSGYARLHWWYLPPTTEQRRNQRELSVEKALFLNSADFCSPTKPVTVVALLVLKAMSVKESS